MVKKKEETALAEGPQSERNGGDHAQVLQMMHVTRTGPHFTEALGTMRMSFRKRRGSDPFIGSPFQHPK